MFPRPLNEQKRLRALISYGVLDSEPEPEFDALARVARESFSMPAALISLVDAERQWCKAASGLEIDETPRESAFCAHTIMHDETLVVPDTKADPRFCANALVMAEPGIRFYAGAPLVTKEGFRLGAVCVIDQVPRPDFGARQAERLAELAGIAMHMLELRKANRALSALTAETEAAQEARKDALALAAREIAAPVSAIAELAQTLAERRLGPLAEERYAPLLAELAAAAGEVEGVARRMLDVPCLDSGEIALQESLVDLFALLERARRSVVATAATKDVSLDLCREGEGLALEADAALTERMLSDLLANAVRFSPVGAGVRVTVVTAASGEVEVQVWDEGPGIGDEAMIALAKGQDDVALGLPLVRRLIELHGGRLAVARRKPAGSVASLRFPAYRVLDEERYAALSA